MHDYLPSWHTRTHWAGVGSGPLRGHPVVQFNFSQGTPHIDGCQDKGAPKMVLLGSLEATAKAPLKQTSDRTLGSVCKVKGANSTLTPLHSQTWPASRL